MKKSKILIPAFAVLALSVGASVTGTVAWFTSSRSANFSSSFATKDLGGSLTIENTAKVGTTKTGDNITVSDYLYHGSYDAKPNKTGELFVASTSDDANDIVGYISKGTAAEAEPSGAPTAETIASKWYAGKDEKSKKLWYAVSWSMKVKLSNPQANSTNYLFLSFEKSEFKDSVENGKTINGLRIALMTTEYCTVIGGNGTEKHVKEAGNFTEQKPAANFTESFTNYATPGANTAIKEAVDADETTLKRNKGCLGVIDNDAGIDVYAVAWYEGEDENVVSGVTMSNVAATLKLYSRTVVK